MSDVVDAFAGKWAANPGTATRAALGLWVFTAMRHLSAIDILAEEHDLSTVAHVHNRQIFEILLQVRRFAQATPSDRERLAQAISACGCLEFLGKLEPVKDHPHVQAGYAEMTEQLTKYDPQVLAEIRAQRGRGRHNWFGTTFTDLAASVSKPGEDLAAAYRLISAEMHDVWALAIGLTIPAPGSLDFRGYPDLDTMFSRAADLVDEATQRYVQIWNEVAILVDAQEVVLDLEDPSS